MHTSDCAGHAGQSAVDPEESKNRESSEARLR